MGSFANTVFSIMLGWLQALVSMIWSALSAKEGESFFQYIGKNWILIAGILCTTGLIADFTVYFFRWAPYKVWKTFWRRLRSEKGKASDQETTVRKETAAEKAGAISERYFGHPDEAYEQQYAFKKPLSKPDLTQNDESDDFYKWRTEEPETEESPAADEITKAGYSVPADSPYRRPEERRRRRRFRINLLGDYEENGEIHYYSPRPMIDQKKAYHAPVYPEKWTGSREQDS